MASTVSESPDIAAAADQKMRGGHPRGLSTLFLTEVWERFSYYGMRALLVLFMTAAVTGTNPGLGFDVRTSAAIYGLYTSMVYLLALPGGWVADKLWGQQRAVFVDMAPGSRTSWRLPTTAASGSTCGRGTLACSRPD